MEVAAPSASVHSQATDIKSSQNFDSVSYTNHVPDFNQKCSCCPYGYHIDLDFLRYLDNIYSTDTLKKLKKIKHSKDGSKSAKTKTLPANFVTRCQIASSPCTVSATENLSTCASSRKTDSEVCVELNLISSAEERRTHVRSSQESLTITVSPKPDSKFRTETEVFMCSSPDVDHREKRSSIQSSEQHIKLSRPKRNDTSLKQSSDSELFMHERITHTMPLKIEETLSAIYRPLSRGSSSSPVDSEASGISPAVLQAIREQMALSLHRMKELEEQVKVIPSLQARIAMLVRENQHLMALLSAQGTDQHQTQLIRSDIISTSQKMVDAWTQTLELFADISSSSVLNRQVESSEITRVETSITKVVNGNTRSVESPSLFQASTGVGPKVPERKYYSVGIQCGYLMEDKSTDAINFKSSELQLNGGKDTMSVAIGVTPCMISRCVGTDSGDEVMSSDKEVSGVSVELLDLRGDGEVAEKEETTKGDAVVVKETQEADVRVGEIVQKHKEIESTMGSEVAVASTEENVAEKEETTKGDAVVVKETQETDVRVGEIVQKHKEIESTMGSEVAPAGAEENVSKESAVEVVQDMTKETVQLSSKNVDVQVSVEKIESSSSVSNENSEVKVVKDVDADFEDVLVRNISNELSGENVQLESLIDSNEEVVKEKQELCLEVKDTSLEKEPSGASEVVETSVVEESHVEEHILRKESETVNERSVVLETEIDAMVNEELGKESKDSIVEELEKVEALVASELSDVQSTLLKTETKAVDEMVEKLDEQGNEIGSTMQVESKEPDVSRRQERIVNTTGDTEVELEQKDVEIDGTVCVKEVVSRITVTESTKAGIESESLNKEMDDRVVNNDQEKSINVEEKVIVAKDKINAVESDEDTIGAVESDEESVSIGADTVKTVESYEESVEADAINALESDEEIASMERDTIRTVESNEEIVSVGEDARKTAGSAEEIASVDSDTRRTIESSEENVSVRTVESSEENVSVRTVESSEENVSVKTAGSAEIASLDSDTKRTMESSEENVSVRTVESIEENVSVREDTVKTTESAEENASVDSDTRRTVESSEENVSVRTMESSEEIVSARTMESSEENVSVREDTVKTAESAEEIVSVDSDTRRTVESSEENVSVKEDTVKTAESSEENVSIDSDTRRTMESSEENVSVREDTVKTAESAEEIVSVDSDTRRTMESSEENVSVRTMESSEENVSVRADTVKTTESAEEIASVGSDTRRTMESSEENVSARTMESSEENVSARTMESSEENVSVREDTVKTAESAEEIVSVDSDTRRTMESSEENVSARTTESSEENVSARTTESSEENVSVRADTVRIVVSSEENVSVGGDTIKTVESAEETASVDSDTIRTVESSEENVSVEADVTTVTELTEESISIDSDSLRTFESSEESSTGTDTIIIAEVAEENVVLGVKTAESDKENVCVETLEIKDDGKATAVLSGTRSDATDAVINKIETEHTESHGLTINEESVVQGVDTKTDDVPSVVKSDEKTLECKVTEVCQQNLDAGGEAVCVSKQMQLTDDSDNTLESCEKKSDEKTDVVEMDNNKEKIVIDASSMNVSAPFTDHVEIRSSSKNFKDQSQFCIDVTSSDLPIQGKELESRSEKIELLGSESGNNVELAKTTGQSQEHEIVKVEHDEDMKRKEAEEILDLNKNTKQDDSINEGSEMIDTTSFETLDVEASITKDQVQDNLNKDENTSAKADESSTDECQGLQLTSGVKRIVVTETRIERQRLDLQKTSTTGDHEETETEIHSSDATGPSKSAIAASQESVKSESYSSDALADAGKYSTSESNLDDDSEKISTVRPEVLAACAVYTEYLSDPAVAVDSDNVSACASFLRYHWFELAGHKASDASLVELHLTAYQNFGSDLSQAIINMADNDGNTAMHYAVSYGNVDVISVLLDSGYCDVDKQNKAGYTALMLASLLLVDLSQHRSLVLRLFQAGNVNSTSATSGQTSLMLASSHGRTEMVELLLEAGADINLQDEDGSTALMCASEHGHADVIQMLLSHPDCDSTLMDIDGSTALSIAMEASHHDIGLLLLTHMKSLEDPMMDDEGSEV